MFSPDPNEAARLSVLVGFWCVLVGFPIAIPVGWVLARRKFWGKSLLGTLFLAPLVLPPVVTGILLLKAFSPSSYLGQYFSKLGITVPFSFYGVVLAALVVGLPLYVLSIRNAFEAIDPRYEEVAMTLGYSRFRTFIFISLPLALPGIFAGALLMFARALGEFGATAVIAGNMEGKTRTLALALYTLLETPYSDSSINKLLCFSLLMAFGALLSYDLMSRWQRRRLEVEP